MLEKSRLTIKKLAEEDRPREKLQLKGKTSLSDAELIAILIRSGNSKQTAVELSQYILTTCDNNLSNLAKLSVRDLEKFNGIGKAKAISIVAALEIGRRRKQERQSRKQKIHTSHDAFELLQRHLMDLSHEELWIVLLKRNNELIGKEMISSGGVSGTLVDAKLIFKRALEETASGIILGHNHPSGDLDPSTEDIKLTKKIREAGNALDISLLDHLIIAENNFYSFAENNLL